MSKKPLIFCFLALFYLSGYSKNYSLDEKVDLLYEAIPGANSQKLKKDLNFFIHELNAFDAASPAKRIKKIFSLTKKKYLENYYLYSFFPDLISENHFNCVTGTALFAIILDELDIPYSIVEMTQHVYLVAYPKSYRIAMESTSERNGVYTWTEHTKIEAVGFLISIGKVTEDEVRLKGVNAIIEEYFYTNEELNFEGIAGLHFINRSLYLSDRKKHLEALNCLSRARQLYQGPTLDLIEGSVLANLIQKSELDSIAIVNYLTRYYSVCGSNPEKQRTLRNFDYVINEALLTRRDMAFIDSTEKLIRLNLPEEDQKLFFALVEETKAIWHFNRGKYDQALIASELSYSLNAKNKNVEDILAVSIINALQDSDLDDKEIGYRVIEYITKYPFLRESPQFVNFEIIVYAVLSGDYYFHNNIAEASYYFDLMQKLLENPEIDLREVSESLAESYAQRSSYHFRIKDYQEAFKWIELALKYDPESNSHLAKREYIMTKL